MAEAAAPPLEPATAAEATVAPPQVEAAAAGGAGANEARDDVPAELLEEWRSEQERMRDLILDQDDLPGWDGSTLEGLRVVAGIDISFFKDSHVKAVAALALLKFPSLEHLHTLAVDVELTQPYKCGFLGFREVPFMVRLLDLARRDFPDLVPQVVLVDGNGVLHPKRCGSASHFGVVADCPTIGVAKNLLSVAQDVTEKTFRQEHKDRLARRGDQHPILDDDGRTVGMAYVNSDSGKPVYISVGHRISLDTAVAVVEACSKHRVPEPVRLADLDSRSVVRDRLGEQMMLEPPKGRDVRIYSNER
ncbi:endonuclease V-like [Sycon ciliatum]|uniref:endonuclease V-like n=1 Tax=Sycon ciliatum TaxID=27933 RepID=UPI0031F6BC72